MKRKCGGCGFTGKAGKRWRIRGAWVRCPSCIELWKKERQQEESLDRDWMDAVK